MPIGNLNDLKFTAEDFSGKDIKSLDDNPKMTAAELKAMFDNVPEEIIADKINFIIDILISSSGASNVGALVNDMVSGDTVQEQLTNALTAFKEAVMDPRVIAVNSITVDKLSSDICFDFGGYGDDGEFI